MLVVQHLNSHSAATDPVFIQSVIWHFSSTAYCTGCGPSDSVQFSCLKKVTEFYGCRSTYCIQIRWLIVDTSIWLVVRNMFSFSIQLGIIIPSDFHIFQRGRYTTNQKLVNPIKSHETTMKHHHFPMAFPWYGITTQL